MIVKVFYHFCDKNVKAGKIKAHIWNIFQWYNDS